MKWNEKIQDFIKNSFFMMSSNVFTLVVSMLTILIIPKVIGVQEYGYWQIYLLYSTYVGFLHFGLNDGIYLRYGGAHYEDLNKQKISSQINGLLLIQIISVALIYTYSVYFLDDINRAFVFKMIALATLIVNMRYIFIFILQATNRIKEYSFIVMLDRGLYIVFLVALLLGGTESFKGLIIADLVAKFLSLVLSIYFCKELISLKIENKVFDFKEMYININVGSKLMFANVVSLLIIGVVRIFIERYWDVETFAKISLTLNISNFLLIFINAMSIVVFPLLKKIEKENLKNLYVLLDSIVTFLLYTFLILYYPLYHTINYWLPQYSIGLQYMAILFPVIVFEGKVVLIINTFLKVMREEKRILLVNLFSLCLSIIVSYISVIILKNLFLSILTILVMLIIKYYLLQHVLEKKLMINRNGFFAKEILTIVAFVIVNWYVRDSKAVVLHIILYMFFVYTMKDAILNSFKGIKKIANT